MRWVVGTLLLVAATLKAIALWLYPETVLVNGSDRFLVPLQVGGEIGLGLMAFSGTYWARLRWISIVLFTVFAVYSFWLAIRGETSCGCFGLVEINPWWTFLLDLIVVFSLAFSGNATNVHAAGIDGQADFTSSVTRYWTFTTVSISLAVAAALFFYTEPKTTGPSELLHSVGNLTILEPENWIGKEFPLSGLVNIDLSGGKWVLLLHRHDCSKCQDAIPKYNLLSTSIVEGKVALIEVPPFGNQQEVASSKILNGRLVNDREWFVQTPIEIQLQDGKVVNSSLKLPSITDQNLSHNKTDLQSRALAANSM